MIFCAKQRFFSHIFQAFLEPVRLYETCSLRRLSERLHPLQILSFSQKPFSLQALDESLETSHP